VPGPKNSVEPVLPSTPSVLVLPSDDVAADTGAADPAGAPAAGAAPGIAGVGAAAGVAGADVVEWLPWLLRLFLAVIASMTILPNSLVMRVSACGAMLFTRIPNRLPSDCSAFANPTTAFVVIRPKRDQRIRTYRPS
jgi:hypothetical protein